MTIESWGPSAWYFLHKLSLTYNIHNKSKYIKCLRLFSDLIPCSICESHFKAELNKINMDIVLKNSNRFFLWTVMAHNLVNSRNQKKIYKYDEATNIYKKSFNKDLIINFIKEFYRANVHNKGALKNFLLLMSELFPENKIRNNLINFNKKFKGRDINIEDMRTVIINIINITKI